MTQPYYAVIFTNTLTEKTEGYEKMAKQMETLARQQPGFLGFESARDTIGISISYWDSLKAISNWKEDIEHKKAQHLGITNWYKNYTLRICKVEREYSFER
ncbi:antibiotic biosynthesis monooxygenase family protein [Patiriisocius hiemis]|uniref:Antibiotic biosynthesis monooxygenase n=1 Tax=Patiriisocius hiemis TaxID=3075604 RepID=A0ABU2YBY6_9FLAO|nr:antibiotic biosynthesis monooxygenase [Constantimarinum sp. W242]MDT0555681.1 antibiotic biosynthesis monooxygenase [Constantimarinum sp. W242]